MAKRRANGEGSLYKRQDGTWTAQYTDCNGKKRYLYGKTQQIVKDKLKEAIKQSDTGIALDTKKITFANWIAEWLEVYAKPVIRPRTYQAYHVQVHQHIIPAFPKVLLKDVREDMLQKFLNDMLERRLDGKPGGYSRTMVNHTRVRLYSSFEKATELGFIPRNPARKLSLPPVERTEKQILTREQQKALEAVIMENLDKDYNDVIFLLMLYTGLRVGEAIGLKVGDIDFQRNELSVRRTLGRVTIPGEKISPKQAGEPKTKTSRRTIPIPPPIVDLLKMVIAKRAERIERLEPMWEKSPKWTPHWKEEDYLFLTFYGNTFDTASVRRILAALEKKAGIEPFVSLHGLRHTFATRWVEAGLDVKSLSEILGHADTNMTLNIYTHSLADQKRASMDKLSGLFDTASGGKRKRGK